MRALRRIRPGESGSVEIIGVMHDAVDEIALAQKDYEMLGIHGSAQGWAPLADDDSPRGGAVKHQDVIGRPPVSKPAGDDVSELLNVGGRHNQFIDDLTGHQLDPDLCKKARAEEFRYFQDKRSVGASLCQRLLA